MAFLVVTDERTGRKRKFTSAKARNNFIADLLREQERLLSGRTLKSGIGMSEVGSKSFGLQVYTQPLAPVGMNMAATTHAKNCQCGKCRFK